MCIGKYFRYSRIFWLLMSIIFLTCWLAAGSARNGQTEAAVVSTQGTLWQWYTDVGEAAYKQGRYADAGKQLKTALSKQQRNSEHKIPVWLQTSIIWRRSTTRVSIRKRDLSSNEPWLSKSRSGFRSTQIQPRALTIWRFSTKLGQVCQSGRSLPACSGYPRADLVFPTSGHGSEFWQWRTTRRENASHYKIPQMRTSHRTPLACYAVYCVLK